MQPSPARRRLPDMHRRRRLIALLLPASVVVALLAAPPARVAACDCMFVEMEEAVRQADAAFVGRLEERVRGGDNLGFPVVDQWRWSVERSRDPDAEGSLVIEAWEEDGANCGVAFGLGERWFVVAHVEDGALTTTGCQPNRRLDGSDAEAEARIVELVPVEVDAAAVGSSGGALDVPGPLLIVLAAVVGIGAVGALAFRGGPRPDG